MRYLMRGYAGLNYLETEVSKEDFSAAKQARLRLTAALAIEEKFNILIENYADLERDLLELTLRHMLFDARTWSVHIDELHTVNRRLVNLLTACRMYLDQVPSDLKDLFDPDQSQASAFVQATNAEYNNSLSYRLCEALRNHVQHAGLPVYTHGYNMAWNDDRTLSVHRTKPALALAKLAEDKKFKKQVLRELEAEGMDTIDVKTVTREYLDGIRNVHRQVRGMINAAKQAAHDLTESYVSSFQSLDAEQEAKHVDMVTLDDRDGELERVPLFLEVSKRIDFLQRRNRLAGKLRKNVVTNEI